jgi:AraC family L-rhamnose operon regulatory protein RhaS
LRTFLIGGGCYDRTTQRGFFPSGGSPVAIEPRLPQAAFPEHHHDFHEIVIVEHGTGIHVFNGQPYTISGGTVCFVRDHDRHLYEHTDNLCLTNVLYRSPDAFQFLSGLNQLLPQKDGHYPSHWRVNQATLQQVRQLVNQMEKVKTGMRRILSPPARCCLCSCWFCCAAVAWWKGWKITTRG